MDTNGLVAVTGGHTEVTNAVTRPIVAGDVQGPPAASRIITAGGARPGNRLLLTKAAGIAGRLIGRIEPGRGVRALRHGRRVSSPWIVRDEIITALGR